jgi:hypothetical protein
MGMVLAEEVSTGLLPHLASPVCVFVSLSVCHCRSLCHVCDGVFNCLQGGRSDVCHGNTARAARRELTSASVVRLPWAEACRRAAGGRDSAVAARSHHVHRRVEGGPQRRGPLSDGRVEEGSRAQEALGHGADAASLGSRHVSQAARSQSVDHLGSAGHGQGRG